MPGRNGSRAGSAASVQSARSLQRVILLSDRNEWAGSVHTSVEDPRISVECAGWALADAIRPPFTALVVDATPPFDRRLALLESSVRREWRRLAISVVPGELGATACAEALEGLGFQVIRAPGVWAQPPVDRIKAAVNGIVDERKWLLPRIMDALGCADPRLMHYIEGALALPPRRTVKSWAKALQIRKPQRISVVLRELGLPRAKDVLSWILLAALVAKANADPRMTYDQLAKAFGYQSGDYLGRYARRLTDHTLGDLIEEGLDGMLKLMAERLRPAVLRLRIHRS